MGKKVQVSSNEKMELICQIKSHFKKNRKVWGNKFWEEIAGTGTYNKDRSAATLRNTARHLSTTDMWKTAMDGLDIPVYGATIDKTKTPTKFLEGTTWNRFQGITLLKAIADFNGELNLQDDKWWEIIKDNSELKSKTTSEVKEFFFEVLVKDLKATGLPKNDIKILRQRLGNISIELGGVFESVMEMDSSNESSSNDADSSGETEKVDSDAEPQDKKQKRDIHEQFQMQPMMDCKELETEKQSISGQQLILEMKNDNAEIEKKKQNDEENDAVEKHVKVDCKPVVGKNQHKVDDQKFSSEIINSTQLGLQSKSVLDLNSVAEIVTTTIDSKVMINKILEVKSSEAFVECSVLAAGTVVNHWEDVEREALATLVDHKTAAEELGSEGIKRSYRYMITAIRGFGMALKAVFLMRYKIHLPECNENETISYLSAFCRNRKHVDDTIRAICQGGLKTLVLGRNQLRYFQLTSECDTCGLTEI